MAIFPGSSHIFFFNEKKEQTRKVQYTWDKDEGNLSIPDFIVLRYDLTADKPELDFCMAQLGFFEHVVVECKRQESYTVNEPDPDFIQQLDIQCDRIQRLNASCFAVLVVGLRYGSSPITVKTTILITVHSSRTVKR